MLRYGNGSVPIATGWKYTNCHRTHRSSIPRSGSGNTRATPELTTGTSRPPRNWPVPCPESLERCKIILSRSDPICFLFADRNVPLLMRGCIAYVKRSISVPDTDATHSYSHRAEYYRGVMWATLRRRQSLGPFHRLPGY